MRVAVIEDLQASSGREKEAADNTGALWWGCKPPESLRVCESASLPVCKMRAGLGLGLGMGPCHSTADKVT